MRKSGFTLVELLVIIGIMAAMVTMSVISVRSGQESFRLKGATRDILAKVRYARSVALVSRHSVRVTYSNESIDGEGAAKIVIAPQDDGFISTTVPTGVQTLSGKPLAAQAEFENKLDEPPAGENSAAEGTSINSMLKPEIDSTLVTGIKIKVIGSHEAILSTRTEAQKRSRVSVSGTNFKLHELEDGETAQPYSEPSSSFESSSLGEINTVDWSSLGTTDEHTIYVYIDGTDYAQGYKIHVDGMGGVKVYGPEEEIEE